jgi:hypothetical protein
VTDRRGVAVARDADLGATLIDEYIRFPVVA